VPITAGTAGTISAKYGDISADVMLNRALTKGAYALGKIEAIGGTISGNVTATQRGIKTVIAGSRSAAGNVEGTISAAGKLRSVRAHGGVLGDLTADWVGTITATNDITGDITANNGDVRTVKSTHGTVASNIDVSGSIFTVQGRSITDSNITAGLDVRTVKTTGTADGEGDLANTTVKAGRHIFTVSTKKSITGSHIESGTTGERGDVRKVSAKGDIIDPLIVAGVTADPVDSYASGELRGGRVKSVTAKGVIRSNDTDDDYIVGAHSAPRVVKDRNGRHKGSFDGVSAGIIVQDGLNQREMAG